MRCRHSRSTGSAAGSAERSCSSPGSRVEVEQLFAGILRVEDVLVARVGQRVPVVLGAVADAVFEIEKTAPRRVLAGNQWQQAAAIERTRGRRSGSIQEGGQHVAQFHHLLQ